jgi:Zn-dependent protease
MRKTLTFAHVKGIPLKLHINWFLIMGVVTWSLSAVYFPFRYPDWHPSIHWLIGTVASLLFFASVLAHELGHSLVAIREGVGVHSITLFIFGGVAHIANEPPHADSDFRIVVSGPFASVTLGAGFYVLGLSTTAFPAVSEVSFYLAYMNFLLAIFNLIPGFPLDGGRILRALIWKISGDYIKATRWATAGGFGIAFLFALLGAGVVFTGSIFAGLWLIFVGWYLGYVARESYRQAKLTVHFQGEGEGNTQKQTGNYLAVRPRTASSAYGTVFIPAGAGKLEAKQVLKCVVDQPTRIMGREFDPQDQLELSKFDVEVTGEERK